MSEIALTVSVLALVAVVGLWIGNVKIRGVGFGIGGVLFGGIIVGHFVDQAGVALSSPMLHFIQEFGLILFVYTIGIQVGPGFFASLRVSGLRLNLFAILIVILGGLVTAVLHKLFNIPLPVVLGIFSGAVTPSRPRPLARTARTVSASFSRADSTAGSSPLMRQAL